MYNKFSNYFFISMVALAFIGLAFLLFTNPGQLVRYILITAAVVGVLYLLIRKFVFSENTANKDQRRFVKAARQTKKKAKRHTKQATTQRKRTAIRKRNVSSNHLTVIEGKKGKKKNRALH